MGRPRERAMLEQGLWLNLNRLVRHNSVSPGRLMIRRTITWQYTYTEETIATALISSDLRGPGDGWLRVECGSLDQNLWLVGQPRHFGGRQWYFLCPVTGKPASVVWMPPGARRFASRQAWRRQVAYASQFETRHGRALTAAQRIRSKLGGPEWAGLDGFDPPKPKWMRQSTYQRMLEKSWAYEDIADQRLIWFMERLGKRG